MHFYFRNSMVKKKKKSYHCVVRIYLLIFVKGQPLLERNAPPTLLVYGKIQRTPIFLVFHVSSHRYNFTNNCIFLSAQFFVGEGPTQQMAFIQGTLTHGHGRALDDLGLVLWWRKEKERKEGRGMRKKKS